MVVLVSNVIDQNLDIRGSVQYRGRLDGIEYLLQLDQTFGTKLNLPSKRVVGEVRTLNISDLFEAKDTVAYRSRASNGDPRMSDVEIRFRDDDLLSVDYYAQSSGFVFARVLFESNDSNRDEVSDKADKYIAFATKVISNYIQVLRLLTSTNALVPFDGFSSPGHRIYASLDNPSAHLDDCPHLSVACNEIEFPIRDKDEPYFIRPDDTDIDTFISEGRNIAVEDQLLLEAKTLAFHNSSCDTAIVLIESSFELFVARVLKRVCEAKNISKLVSRGKNNRKRPYDRLIDESNIERLLSDVATQVIGGALNGGHAYDNWSHDCKSVRNGIIHRGKLGHSMQDARKAFDSMMAFREEISRIVQA